MPDAASIDATQAWLQAAILAGAAPAGEARERVHGDNRLTAEARLAIYAQAYRQRLLEALRGEYPLLAALAGPTAFDLFATGYIAASPSRSFTLYDVGAGFADHLAAARPAGDERAVEAIPAALARIERAIAEVSRARGLEGRPPCAAATPGPALTALLGLGADRYRRPASVRLLALPFDFTRLLAAAPGTTLPLPDPAPSWLAVARLDWRVRCHPIDESQHRWLAALPGEDDEDGSPAAPPDRPVPAGWRFQAEARGLIVARG